MEEKSVIFYYSHSGNTEKIARIIHGKAGGDLIRLEPENPYPREYRAVVEQARKEIKAGFAPKLKLPLQDLSPYRMVYIGSPNWCSTIAPPVKSFLVQCDFSGKIVIPFCTHGGGGAGRIFSDIPKECGGAIIKEGLVVRGDGGDGAEKMIADWLGGLGLN